MKTSTSQAHSVLRSLRSAIAASGLALLARQVVNLASEFETSFAGVRKTVDAAEADIAVLAAGMRDLALTIPVNVNELNRIGEAAGQLGIKTSAILEFTRTIADLGVATNLTADEAATSLARLANITGLQQDQFDRLGSAIVDLGNRFAATESEIVALGLRMAGAGEIAGLTEAQILAVGAALSSVGVEAEAGGTAVQKVLLGMTQAAAQGSEDLQVFAQTAGLTVAQFRDLFERDAGAAFTAFVEGLGRQGDQAFQTLEALDLTDQRLIRSFLSLANAGDLLARTMKTGTEAFAENTALTTEAEKRYKTFDSVSKLLGNSMRELAIVVGSEMLPAIADAARELSELAKNENVKKFFKDLGSEIGEVIEAFGDLTRSIANFDQSAGELVSVGIIGFFDDLGRGARLSALELARLSVIWNAIKKNLAEPLSPGTDVGPLLLEFFRIDFAQLDRINAALDETSDAFADLKRLRAGDISVISEGLAGLPDTLGETATAGREAAGSIASLTDEQKKAIKTYQEHAERLARASIEQRFLTEATRLGEQAFHDAEITVRLWNAALDARVDPMSAAGQRIIALEREKIALEEEQKTLDNLAESARNAADALDELLGERAGRPIQGVVDRFLDPQTKGEFDAAWDEIFGGVDAVIAAAGDRSKAVWVQMAADLKSAMLPAFELLADALLSSLTGASVDVKRLFTQLGQQIGAQIGAQWGPYGSLAGGLLGGLAGNAFGGLLGGGGNRTVGGLSIQAGQVTVAFGELSDAVAQINDELERLEQLTGGSIELAGSVSIRIKENGDVWVRIGESLSFQVRSVQEAMDRVLVELLRTAETSNLPEQVAAVLRNTTALTFQELQDEIDFALSIARLDMTPVEEFFFDLRRETEASLRRALELGINPEPIFADLARRIQEQFERLRTAAEVEEFGLALEEQRRRLEEQLANARSELDRISQQLEALGEMAAEAGLRLGAKLAARAAELEALVRILEGQLAALPTELPAFRGTGGGGRKQGREQLRDEISRMEQQALPDFSRQIAEILLVIPELTERIRDLKFSSEEAAQLLERAQAVVDAQVRRMIEGVQAGIDALAPAGSGLSQQLAAIARQSDLLRDQLQQLADAGLLSADAFAAMLAQLEANTRAAQELAVGTEADALLVRALEFLGRGEEAARIRFELEKAQLLVAIEELRLAQERLGLELSVIDNLAELAGKIAALEFTPPKVPDAPRFTDAVDNTARELDRLREAFARAKDGIREFLAQMGLGEFGGVAPREALAFAEQRFTETLRKARGGDLAAFEAITGTAQDYLRLGRQVFASSPEFQRIFDLVQSSLTGLLGVTRVTEGNLVIDERIYRVQQEHVAVSTRGWGVNSEQNEKMILLLKASEEKLARIEAEMSGSAAAAAREKSKKSA